MKENECQLKIDDLISNITDLQDQIEVHEKELIALMREVSYCVEDLPLEQCTESEYIPITFQDANIGALII